MDPIPLFIPEDMPTSGMGGGPLSPAIGRRGSMPSSLYRQESLTDPSMYELLTEVAYAENTGPQGLATALQCASSGVHYLSELSAFMALVAGCSHTAMPLETSQAILVEVLDRLRWGKLLPDVPGDPLAGLQLQRSL